MDIPRKQLLKRWKSLQDILDSFAAQSLFDCSQPQSSSSCCLLPVSVAYRLSPIFVAAVSTVTGWVIAERNALQLRVSQWPIFSEYIDCDRVRRDCGEGA
jgi:hypothetical protein